MSLLNIKEKKMPSRNYIILILCCFLYGCKDYSNFKGNLTEEGCTWDELRGSKKVTYTFRFNNDNSCYCYIYYIEGDIGINPEGDVILANTWDLNNDTFRIRGWQGAILRYNSDTIIIQNFSSKAIDTLVKNCSVGDNYNIDNLKGFN